MREQADILKNIPDPALLGRKADAALPVEPHRSVADDAPCIRAKQTRNCVQNRGFSRSGNSPKHRDARLRKAKGHPKLKGFKLFDERNLQHAQLQKKAIVPWIPLCGGKTIQSLF